MNFKTLGWTVAIGGLVLSMACTENRIPDKPAPEIEETSFSVAPLGTPLEPDIVTSKNKTSKIKSVIVVTRDTGVSKLTDTNEYQRMVRKVLLKKGVEVVVGEVRARVEQSDDLQNRKENLDEAEKLVLLGEKTGADAIFVFDSIGFKTVPRDMLMEYPSEDGMSIKARAKAGKEPMECPDGFRVDIPALVTQGRVVDTKASTIIAEFSITQFIFRDADLMGRKHNVKPFDAKPVEGVGDIFSLTGTKNYTYVMDWEMVDVRCKTAIEIASEHVMTMEELGAEEVNGAIQGAIDTIVTEIF